MKKCHMIVLGSALTIAPFLSHSQEHARFAVTAGFAGQNSDAEAPVDINLSNVPVACQTPRCAELETSSDDNGATIGLSWYITPAIAVELWGSQSRSSATEVDVERAPDVGLTKYRAQPLALTAQYHYRLNDRFTPFVGIGWQKTSISGVSGNPDVSQTSGLKIDDANGFAAVAGLDLNFGERWFARGDIRYLDGDSRVQTTAGPARHMGMSTVTYGVSAGLRF
jgi:outer membrane protein